MWLKLHGDSKHSLFTVPMIDRQSAPRGVPCLRDERRRGRIVERVVDTRGRGETRVGGQHREIGQSGRTVGRRPRGRDDERRVHDAERDDEGGARTHVDLQLWVVFDFPFHQTRNLKNPHKIGFYFRRKFSNSLERQGGSPSCPSLPAP
jgi:hypothetical protein